jgi:hypothetical protein
MPLRAKKKKKAPTVPFRSKYGTDADILSAAPLSAVMNTTVDASAKARRSEYQEKIL